MRLQNSKNVFKQFLPFDSLDRDLKIIFVSNLLAAFGDGFIIYLLPLFIRSLNATPENVGLLYSLSTAAAALTMIPGGFLADKYDRKKILLLNWLLWIPIPIVFFFAGEWTQLLIPMFIYGITLSGSASSAYILGHCKEGKMASAFTTLGAAYAVGYIFSPATAGFLSSAIDVRAPFIFTAVFYSLAALTLTRIASQRPVKTENPQTKMVVPAEKANFRKLGPVVALFAAMMFVLTLISALVPQFLRDVNHYDQGSILNLGSVYYLGAFVLSLVVGKIGDKYGKTSAVSFSMLLFAGALAVFVTFGGFDFQLVSAFLRGVSFSMWAYIGVLAGSIAPVTQQAKWISVVQTAARVASVPAAFVGGLLYEMSYQIPFIVCIVVALVLSVLVSFRFHRSKQKSSVEVVE
jgi:MFS family permease